VPQKAEGPVGTAPGASNPVAGTVPQSNRPNAPGTTIFIPTVGTVPWDWGWTYGYGPWTYGFNGYGSLAPYGPDYPNGSAPIPSDYTGGNVNNSASSNLQTPTQTQLSEDQMRLRKRFEATDAFQSALRDAREAQAAYDAAYTKARADLKNSPEYQKAVAEKQKASDKVEAAQAAFRQPPASTQPVPQPVINAAQQKLDAATEVSSLENSYVLKDPDVAKARDRYMAAATKLSSLNGRFNAALAADTSGSEVQKLIDSTK
jgi:hypothetical protein